MNHELIQRTAELLATARESRHPVPPLSAHASSTLTVEDAYAIQRATTELRRAQGTRVVGHKVGLTSAAMQAALGVGQPDFGVLLDDMVLPDGAVIGLDRLIQPRIEMEIAFVLGEDLAGPGVTAPDVIAVTAALAPALEIIDSRIEDWRIGLIDTIADNASSGLAVVGAGVPPSEAGDLRLLGMLLTVDGTVVDSGAGGAVLGHPATAVAWLANTLAAFGEHLRTGDVVLSGATHRAVAVPTPVRMLAEFDRLGSVAVEFTATGRKPNAEVRP